MDCIYPLTSDDKEYYKDLFKLIEVYALNKLPLEFHLRYMQQFSIKTEVIINEPKIYFPIQARYWEVEKWLYKGKIVDYDFLRKLPDFKGYGNFCQLYIIELWDNGGDDGHTERVISGYGLGTIKSLNLIKERK